MNKKIKYQQEHIDWIIKNFDKCTYKQLAEEFNKKFEIKTNLSQISDICSKRLKLNKTINRGEYGNGGIKKKSELYTEKKFNNYWYIKINDISTNDKQKDFKNNWKQKQVYIYEQHYEKLKDSEIVIFLDGNKDNFNIDNLYKIKRSENVQLAKKRVHNNGILTKAFIEIIRAEKSLKNIMECE